MIEVITIIIHVQLYEEADRGSISGDWLDADGRILFRAGSGFLGVADAAERQRLSTRGTCNPQTGAWLPSRRCARRTGC